MSSLLKFKIFVTCFLVCICPRLAESARRVPVDIVLCLDLSGSTNGLLIDFKERYWEIINEAEKFNPPIQLRIGFISYSRPSNGKENAYVRLVHDLTDDFDALAREVFEIKTITQEGKQFVGAALQSALNTITWSKEGNALKMIFAVGNGSAFLGGNQYIDACEKAKAKGIFVNTIFCKTYVSHKDMQEWKAIAERTGGIYDEIDINKKLPINPPTKNKEILAQLNTKFNESYIPYGTMGIARLKFMQETDSNLAELGEAPFCERVNAKASGQFLEKNDSWDLVDLSLKKKILWEKMDTLFLPDEMKSMSNEQKDLFLELKWTERRNMISAIRPAYKSWKRDRNNWIIEMNATEINTLGKVVIYAMEKQAASKGMFKD